MKSIEESFTDWEAYVFGFGYGTGEEFTLPALKNFLEAIPVEGHYDHNDLGKVFGPLPAWLLINILCDARIIEYGTSPRYGWLTPQGKRLREFVAERSSESLYELTCRDEDYNICRPGTCNCGPNGYEQGRKCGNPFWKE